MYISLRVVILMSCSLSSILSHFIPPSSLFYFLPSVFVCVLCFSVSQADDDSSQTSPDYTVRPNIKIHNLGE